MICKKFGVGKKELIILEKSKVLFLNLQKCGLYFLIQKQKML